MQHLCLQQQKNIRIYLKMQWVQSCSNDVPDKPETFCHFLKQNYYDFTAWNNKSHKKTELTVRPAEFVKRIRKGGKIQDM